MSVASATAEVAPAGVGVVVGVVVDADAVVGAGAVSVGPSSPHAVTAVATESATNVRHALFMVRRSTMFGRVPRDE